MFSEYASRFLAQSQSRLSIGPLDNGPSPERHRSDRNRPLHSSRLPASRSYLHRQNMASPYHGSASQISRFPFASRTSAAPAPLFYSATDDFREEDDGEEHEREVADYYALQKSRRNFGASHLTESTDADDDDADEHKSRHSEHDAGQAVESSVRGIRSSWRGSRLATTRGRDADTEALGRLIERDSSVGVSEKSGPSSSSKGKGPLVDVELSSASPGSLGDPHHGDFDNDDDDDDDRPPAFQKLRRSPPGKRLRSPLQTTLPIPQETDEEALLDNPRPTSPDRESVPPVAMADALHPPLHDPFWTWMFIIAKCFVFGFWFLAWGETYPPRGPIGDTIYTALHASFHLLGVYSLISIIVGLFWLALLRSFVRPLIFLIIFAVPSLLLSFFIYPLVASYKGTSNGESVQDKVMRGFSLIPGISLVLWVYTVWKGRVYLARAAELLEFTGRVLQANPHLVLVGFAILSTIVLWTWIWILMFTRLFLEGHVSESKFFIIDVTTWWLGAAFILDYIWTLSVISGVQRCITAATVSQWYFHRNAIPSPSSRIIVQAAAKFATHTMFGTICFSTFLSVAVRLPLLLLPRRFVGVFTLFLYNLIPTPIAALTNPLSLTYAAIHSEPLTLASRNLTQLSFVSTTSPTTTLTPRSFRSGTPPLLPYRLAKLILHALRFAIAIALGFGGWISTARNLRLQNPDGSGVKGSMYAYVIGLIAGAIGWGVLGAMEGILGGVLDAIVVCWGSEVGAHGDGEVRFCREAGDLLGDTKEARRGRRRY